jgi:hypothetical protein
MTVNTIQGLKQIPVVRQARLGVGYADVDVKRVKTELEGKMYAAARKWADDGRTGDVIAMMANSAVVAGVPLPAFWPFFRYEFLSPIGIAHFYRQLYFNTQEGVGPIEEAFTIAPLENLEVLYQSVRPQVHEEILEQGLEVVSESAVEEKNLDEVSDKVSSMVQQDASASMSANASGSVGVWQAGASTTANLNTSTQNSREVSNRRLKELTNRASERITKSFSIKTHDLEEVTTTNLTRRVIRNELKHPVSYGLRRVLRRVLVKVQDLGPRLVWQLYLRDPGEGLARSKFVHFREADPIALPDIPPGCPPKPTGGTDTGSSQVPIIWSDALVSDDTPNGAWSVTIVITPGPDRDITSVRIDSITDLESQSKDDPAPSVINNLSSQTWDDSRTYTAVIAVLPGDSTSVQVNYTYTYEPSQSALNAWEVVRQNAWNQANEELLTEQFEKNKRTITERSKIKSRPANDLRKEERYEVMNRMISYLFGRGDDPSEPTPLEIEQFHRFFDIEGMFVTNHPSWWKPRFSGGSVGFGRERYEVTAESEPAALGSSLGWLIQLDGDRRRNEFVNSAWARVCLPMRPDQERAAIEWLAKHLEGEIGYNTNAGPLAALLTGIEQIRTRERALGVNGSDYVKVDSTPGAPADPTKPEGVYPVINEYEVTLPTDGFVYDELTVRIP